MRRRRKLWQGGKIPVVGYVIGVQPYIPSSPSSRKLWGVVKKSFLVEMGSYCSDSPAAKIRRKLVEVGLCFLSGKPILLRRWSRDTQLEKEKLDIDSGIFHCNSEKINVQFLGNMGKPLYIDESTAKGSRGEYARVCIEVESTFGFPFSIKAESLSRKQDEIQVTYDWKQPIYSHHFLLWILWPRGKIM
jgi:hypothetical protein